MCHLWDNVEKYGEATEAADVHMAYARYMLDKATRAQAHSHTHTHIMHACALTYINM